MLDVAVRPVIMRAPDPNPPFDPVGCGWEPRVQMPGQGVLALDFRTSRFLGLRPPAEPGVDADRAEPEPFSRMLAVSLADCVSGTRTPAQLRPWLTRNVQRRVAYAARLAGDVRYRVDAVHVRVVSPDVLEVAATLRARSHAHAMAFRLEGRGRSWVCTVLEVGVLPRRR
ncbi:MAG: Rv3235 family protein [Sporichthyaceae bacterium]